MRFTCVVRLCTCCGVCVVSCVVWRGRVVCLCGLDWCWRRLFCFITFPLRCVCVCLVWLGLDLHCAAWLVLLPPSSNPRNASPASHAHHATQINANNIQPIQTMQSMYTTVRSNIIAIKDFWSEVKLCLTVVVKSTRNDR